MFAIVPISYSEKLSFKNLFDSYDEVGTLLWMVFGTFTNLFTYKSDKSLNKSKKNSTCVMIGEVAYSRTRRLSEAIRSL